MNEQIQNLEQQIFVPALSIKRITTRETLGKILITYREEPEIICGVARRIGYTGKSDEDLAIYRLKIKTIGKKTFSTLSTLFVVDEGVFLSYEKWCNEQQNKNV